MHTVVGHNSPVTVNGHNPTIMYNLAVFFYAQLGERLNKECAERARILPRNTSATSSPTVEVAMELAKEAYKPRLTLEHWIGDNKFAPSVASAGVKSIDDIKEKRALRLQILLLLLLLLLQLNH